MKPYILTLAVAATSLTACHSARLNYTDGFDDVYYSSNDAPTNRYSEPDPANYSSANNNDGNANGNDGNANGNDQSRFDYGSEDSVSTQDNGSRYADNSYSTSGGNTYVTNNNYYYDEDDYYDYAYSSRIRRFHTNVGYGYGYYNDYYTNSYWYDYNPWSYGVSIYLGYRWWRPNYTYYYNYCYTPIGYYGYNPWYAPGYNPYYYSPYYSYWGGYGNGYNHGYNNGYWDGYYDGYYGNYHNPYYFNSYDNSSYYYGPRGRRGGNLASNSGTTNTIGNLYQTSVRSDDVKNPRGYTPKNGLNDSENSTSTGKDPRTNSGSSTANPRNNSATDNYTGRDNNTGRDNSTTPKNVDSAPVRGNNSSDGKPNNGSGSGAGSENENPRTNNINNSDPRNNPNNNTGPKNNNSTNPRGNGMENSTAPLTPTP
ncbi:MAG: hypothetical protein ACKOYC_03690, partial [Bacteroidota bacterium]